MTHISKEEVREKLNQEYARLAKRIDDEISAGQNRISAILSLQLEEKGCVPEWDRTRTHQCAYNNISRYGAAKNCRFCDGHKKGEEKILGAKGGNQQEAPMDLSEILIRRGVHPSEEKVEVNFGGETYKGTLTHPAPALEEWGTFVAFIRPFRGRAYTQDTADEIERRVKFLLSKERERWEDCGDFVPATKREIVSNKMGEEAERHRILTLIEGMRFPTENTYPVNAHNTEIFNTALEVLLAKITKE